MSSPSSTLPLFWRKYDLTLTTTVGDVITLSSDSFEPESLRITFDVQFVGYKAAYTAFISVYNVNSALMQTVINQGSLVTLNAGYQVGSNYGTIFKGQVLRCTFEKENVTDHKLTLQCIRNLSTKC